MKRVYREARPRRLRRLGWLLLAVVGGCGGESAAREASPNPGLQPRRYDLATFLASRPSQAVDLAPDRGLAVGFGRHATLFDLATGERAPLESRLPGEPAMPLRFFPSGGSLLFTRPADDPAAGGRIHYLGESGALAAFSPSARAYGRFLGWSPDAAGFFLVRPGERTQAGAREELALISTRGAPAQTLYVADTGFRIAAVAPRGDRIALVRELDPDSTEVLLHDRTRGETRLLLPVDRDARFLPQGFAPDGARLLLFDDEGKDTLQLELLTLETGERQLRPRPGCEARDLELAPDGAIYALQWSCAGRLEAGLFETLTGAELGALPLPLGTRLARALPGSGPGGVLYEVASARYPRDLVYAERADPDARARPLTFGLAPEIAAEDLVEPEPVVLRSSQSAGAPEIPGELWWPLSLRSPPAALVWIDDDPRPPVWGEFQALIQFLANRGIAVLRLRLRGAEGFGRRFRHAADGRLVDAGLEDLDAARQALERRGADLQRLAVLGDGPWGGAIAALALAERQGRYLFAAGLGASPDPLQRLDLLPGLAEPGKSWWLARLGDPAAAAAVRDRARVRAPQELAGERLFSLPRPYAESTPEEIAALWAFLEPRLARER